MKKLLCFLLLTPCVFAAPIKGFEANYHDWDLICDNRGTCQMVGYQTSDFFDYPVSLRFERKAGDNTPVIAEIIITSNQDENPINLNSKLELFLNNQSIGTIPILLEKPSRLSEQQSQTLLRALKKNAVIHVKSGNFNSQISDKGAAAAMLKMDEFQQRLNTPSALIRQGSDVKAVLAPQKTPTIYAVKIPQTQAVYDIKRGSARFDKVMALLRQSNGTNEDSGSYCYSLHSNEKNFQNQSIGIYPLTNGKVLAEAVCMAGAYQTTNYYVVMNDKLTRVEQVLENRYDEAGYDKKQGYAYVSGEFKARGLGDCWVSEQAVWNGKIFLRSQEGSSGSCKGFIGGAWGILPTFTSHIEMQK